MENKHTYSLTTLFTWILTISIAAFILYTFAEIWIMLIIALLLSMIFKPIVDFIEAQGIKRTYSVLIVFVSTGVISIFGISIILPKIVHQMKQVINLMTPENLDNTLGQVEKVIHSTLPFLRPINLSEKISADLQGMFNVWISDLTNIVESLFAVIAILIIVPFVTYFLLKDSTLLLKGIINIMPNKYFEVSYWVIRKISLQLSKYVRSWIFDAMIVGIMSGLGLAILGINNSASIGFVAGVGHLIPYFGPIIGGLPAILISVVQFGDFSMLPKIILMFLAVYALDNGFIQPNLFSKSTDIHPLGIIILILIGSKLLGIIGMLLAVPTATVIKTAAKEFYYGYKNYKVIRM
ncbi:AI-2E family transporter [Melioribacter sp. OK-6-Me]|uniref:AI-2E family transporter n=1 Tax=unclassified Melioribacter TaxID=2627329 RepID=UPI003EDB45F6